MVRHPDAAFGEKPQGGHHPGCFLDDAALAGPWGGAAVLDYYPDPSDAKYKRLVNSLLQAPADTTGIKPTLTIDGLTTGHTYRLQIICNLPRNGVVEVAVSSDN